MSRLARRRRNGDTWSSPATRRVTMAITRRSSLPVGSHLSHIAAIAPRRLPATAWPTTRADLPIAFTNSAMHKRDDRGATSKPSGDDAGEDDAVLQ